MAAPSIFLVVLLAFIVFASADEDVEEGNTQIKLLGKSGKCLIGRKGKDGKKRDLAKDGFVIEVDHVKEISADGSDAGKKLNTLASQDFKFSKLRRNSNYQGISAVNLDLNAYLELAEANLTLSVYIFKEKGNVTFGNETYEVDKGVVKFVIKIENYTFCDGNKTPSKKCKKMGKFLEVAIRVKNRKGEKGKAEAEDAKKKRGKDGDKKTFKCPKKCPKIFAFGADEVVVANECQVDGVFKAMPSGFPKFEDNENIERFIYRADRFNSTVVFDPAVNTEEIEDEENQASSIHLNIFMFVAMLAAYFM